MKRIIVFCILAIMACSCGKGYEYDIFGAINGVVIDADTQEPLNGATVNLSPSGKTAITGGDGIFRFEDLESMQYTVTVQKSGYDTDRRTVNVGAGETAEITIMMLKL